MLKRLLAIFVSLWVVVLGPSCEPLPYDMNSTLEQVQNQKTLRVGRILRAEELTLEKQLVQSFARTLDAEISWIEGSEHELFEKMESGELDLVMGGIVSSMKRHHGVGLTWSYHTQHRGSSSTKYVMAVPAGENAFLMRLEAFLKAPKQQQRIKKSFSQRGQ